MHFKKVLGDEMGLGKTIQVISFLAAVLRKKGLESDLDATRPECVKKVNKKISMNREKNNSKNNFISPKELNIDTSKKQRPFLISCPASIVGNWEDELNRWGYFSIG